MKNTDIAGRIMELAQQRGPEKSFCPSAVARIIRPGEEVRLEEVKWPIRIQMDE